MQCQSYKSDSVAIDHGLCKNVHEPKNGAELFSLCVIPLLVASAFGFQIDEIETELSKPKWNLGVLNDQEPLAEVASAGEYILFIEHAQIIAFVSYAALAATSTIEEASEDS